MATATKRQAEGDGGRDDARDDAALAASQTTQGADDAAQGSTPTAGALGGVRDALANVDAEKLARGLGWFSIGLGLSELLAPRAVAGVAGVRGNYGFIRLMGVREILHGVAIFAQGRRPAAAVWARVAGDALDLAALGGAYLSPHSDKGRLTFATANVLAVTALDVVCARRLSGGDGEGAGARGATRVRKSLVINRPAEELYGFWRDFENLPQFMHHLEAVRVTGEGRSHWVARGPMGSRVEWDAEITEDRPAELISWRSLEGSEVENAGTVRFEPAPGGRGTVVRVEIEYAPPGGALGAAVAWLSGEEPGQQAQESLRSFKQLMEAGEVTLSDGTVWDNGLLTQRPARPPSGGELGETRAGAGA